MPIAAASNSNENWKTEKLEKNGKRNKCTDISNEKLVRLHTSWTGKKTIRMIFDWSTKQCNLET